MTEHEKIIAAIDKELLVQMVTDLESKLKKKNAEILIIRTKLRSNRVKMMKMKNTILYQRKRIVDLYPDHEANWPLEPQMNLSK